MKTFRDLVIVKQPLPQVYSMVRDRLPEIAAELDDIAAIVCLEHTRLEDGRHRCTNRWTSSQRIPALLQGHLGAADVSWLDRNEWDDQGHVCTWSIEPSLLAEHIRCTGRTSFEPAMGGRGTRVTLSGEFALAPGALKSLAGPLEQPALACVESIVTVFIPRNLRKVVEAAARASAA